MKKFRTLFLSVILVLALCLGLVACAQTTQYTLTFEMNGHGEQVQAQKLGADEIPESPEKPSADGWRFDGWYEDEDFTDLFYFDTPLYEDTTVYAKWTRVYNVTFDTGVSDYTLAPQQVAIGKKVNLPLAQDIKSAGKKFEGWYTDPTYNSAFTSDTAITNNITLYAKWSPYYEVKFDNNGVGAANRVPQTQTYTVEGSVAQKPADMSVNTYKFLGWSLDKDGARGFYDFDTQLTDSITLYAQWIKVYSVSFNLNNEEAFQTPPETESVEEGGKAEMPTVDPVLDGWKFEGWYTAAEGGEEFDFENTEIRANQVVYAHWTSNKVETLDVELPSYEYVWEAPYGERPDLDGFIIDGKMGEEENWEDQKWYTTAVTEAPTITMSVTTKFSEKGLYIFVTVEDNGGLYMMGKNWYDRNSNIRLYVGDGVNSTQTFLVDTLSLFPTSLKTKLAINIPEGEVNTANAENKRAVMNVEIFTTWKDLGFEPTPTEVKISAVYSYKRIAADNIKYTLTTPFVDPNKITSIDYILYDANGYTKSDAENATLGDSSLNISKTPGWDISHESDETDAYVSTNGLGTTQAIFYKNVLDTIHYDFEFEIDASSYTSNGKAGAIIYSTSTNYAMLLFAVDSTTYDKSNHKFTKAKPYMRVTDKDGKLITKTLDEIDVSDTGRIQVKIVFSNSYIYCILNEVLFHCEFVEDLTDRTNPGLASMDGGAGIKFRNYSAQVLTVTEAQQETAKYAYVISKGRLRNLSIDLNTTGVSTKPGASKKIVMSLTNSNVSLTNAQKNKILETGEIDSRITVYQLESLIFTVNGVQNDIIDAVTDPETGAKWGEFVYDYPFEGNAVITNTSSVVPVEDLTYIKGTIVDSINGKAIAATATITSNNPRLGKYDMSITSGEIVLIVPKGYDYKISFNQTAYRTTTLDVITNVTEPQDLGEIKLVSNVLGGTAQSKKTNFSVGSSVAGWDLSNESDGIIIFETTGANPPTVYFSGYTINEYQYAKVSVTNITDTTAYATYEKDPAIGFEFKTKSGAGAFIGLRTTGLRYLPNRLSWCPEQINGYGKDTCNYIDVTGEHKDTLEIIRIGRSLYSWINGVYMGCIIMEEFFGGEAAIGVQGTFSYYGKIVYRDYEIQVGDAAVAIAKERVGLSLDLDKSAYSYKDGSWSEIDEDKPLVSISGLTEIIKEDNSRENIALAGNSITVTRTEFVPDDEIINVKIGSYGTVVLSAGTPSGTIVVPGNANGTATITVTRELSSTISGKFVSSDESIVGPFTGYALLVDSGAKLDFTTGEDGSFAVDVPVGVTVTIKLNTLGYVSAGASTKSNGTAGKTKNVGEMEVYKSILGGKVAGTQYASTGTGKYTVDYDNDEATVIEGEYVDVEVTGGNYTVAINTGTFTNFDISFSLIRYQYSNKTNESDPGFGLQVLTNGANDQILFWKDGVRCMNSSTGFAGRTEFTGAMSWSTANSYNIPVDFRIIKRSNMYVMFYKLHTETEWKLVHVQTGIVSGSAGVMLMSTNTYNNHYRIWNVQAKDLIDSEIPDELKANVSASIVSGSEAFGSVTLSGGTEVNGNIEYIFGDTVTATIKVNPGYSLAWVKVNGVITEVYANRLTLPVNSNSINIEVLFEAQFMTYEVTGKIAVDTTYMDFALPKTVNIVAYMEDGRSYQYNGLTVENDGSVAISLREGTFKIYAYSTTLSSKTVDLTVSETSRDFGTLTLSVMRSGNMSVNGVAVTSGMTLTENFEKGMLSLPGTLQSVGYLSEAVVDGDFVFSTDMIQTGGANSENYTNDHVAGVQFTNGSKTFAIQFWSKGFRISAGGWSETAMLYPTPSENTSQYFVDDLAAGTSRVHSLAFKRVGTDLMMYVDGTHLLTFSVEKGYEWAPGKTGTDGYEAKNKDNVKDLYASVFGDATAQIGVGLRCNLYASSSTYINKIGYFNTIMTNKADLISSFNGKF